jgi:hypothetical protein
VFKKIKEESAEDFEYQPWKPGGWKEDQLQKGED